MDDRLTSCGLVGVGTASFSAFSAKLCVERKQKGIRNPFVRFFTSHFLSQGVLSLGAKHGSENGGLGEAKPFHPGVLVEKRVLMGGQRHGLRGSSRPCATAMGNRNL